MLLITKNQKDITKKEKRKKEGNNSKEYESQKLVMITSGYA